MPEGPEVRREADIISSALTGKVIKKIWAEYPELNKNMKVHGTPWKFSKTPANIRRAPKLGEHNNEILFDLGYTKGEIKSLKDDKII